MPCGTTWTCAKDPNQSPLGTCKAVTGACECNDGYVTRDCGVRRDSPDDTACSVHGIATVFDSYARHDMPDRRTPLPPNQIVVSCHCQPGYGLHDCSSRCGGNDTTPCSGHGTCLNGTWQPGRCLCDAGWAGDACDQRCCSGHGIYGNSSRACSVDGSGLEDCFCDPGFVGAGCQTDERPAHPAITAINASTARDVSSLAVHWRVDARGLKHTDVFRTDFAEVAANASEGSSDSYCNGPVIPSQEACDVASLKCMQEIPGLKAGARYSVRVTAVNGKLKLESASEAQRAELPAPNCSSGEVADSASGKCVACLAGKQPNSDGTVCEDCPPLEVAAFGATCAPCSDGSIPSRDRSYCAVCPAGEQPNRNRTACERCPDGTFSSGSGASSCRRCNDPAVNQSGTTASADRTYCLPCPMGTYVAPGSPDPSCRPCPPFQVAPSGSATCERCDPGQAPSHDNDTCVTCPNDQFSLDGTRCLACPKLDVEGRVVRSYSRGAQCANGRLTIKDSFWYNRSEHRAVTAGTVLYRCVSARACRSAPSSSSMRCGKGHDEATVLCGSCLSKESGGGAQCDYALQSDGSCVCCASPAVVWLTLLAGLGAVAWVLSTSLRSALRSAGGEEGEEGEEDRPPDVAAMVAKIGVNYVQTTSLLAGFDLDWGRSVRYAFSAMGLAGGAVVQAISLQCVVDISYASRAVVTLVGLPLAIVLGPGAALLVRRRWLQGGRPGESLRARWWASSLVLVWLLYSTIAHEAFRVVHCVNVEGRLWLRADLRVACEGSEYAAVRGLAVVVIACVVAGVPLGLAAGMRRSRAAARSEDVYSFLADPYAARFCWWETTIMLRKAALIAVLSYIPAEQGDLRVYVGLGVLQVPLLLHAVFLPYRKSAQNRLEGFALVATFLTLFVGQAISLEILPKPEGEGGGDGGDGEGGDGGGGEGGADAGGGVLSSKNVALALVTAVNAGVVVVMMGVVGSSWTRSTRKFMGGSLGTKVAMAAGEWACCGGRCCRRRRHARSDGSGEDWDDFEESLIEGGSDGLTGGLMEGRRERHVQSFDIGSAAGE